MDEKAQSNTLDGSEAVNNSPSLSHVQLNEVAQDAAEYLRSLGLTVAYEDTFQRWMLDEPRKLVSASEDPTGLTPCIGLPACFIPPKVSAPEKWEVRGKSLALLHDVCKRQSEAEVDGLINQIRKQVEANNIRGMKIELPVLRTDNDTDLRRYTRRISATREVHLSDHHLPLEPCDEEQDEGLEFPKQAYAADRKITQSVENEKIEISRQSFEALVKYSKADWTEADQDVMRRRHVKYQGVWSSSLPRRCLVTLILSSSSHGNPSRPHSLQS